MKLTPSPVLTPLPPEVYEPLRDDIAQNGVRQPILVTSSGIIIDGHGRYRAVIELGIRKYPIRVIGNISEQERREMAISLNLLHRHFSQAERQHWLAELVRLNPHISSRDLAAKAKVSQSTAARAKSKVLGTESGDSVEVAGHNGKTYHYKPKPAVGVESPQSAIKAGEYLETLGSQAPAGGSDLRKVQKLAERQQKKSLTAGRNAQPPGNSDIMTYHCPFQDLERVAALKPATARLILTDIPYGQEFLSEIPELAAFASRVLVEGGLFVTYAGQYWLDKVFAGLGRYLTYRWCNASVWQGIGNVAHLGGWRERHGRIVSKWKPILVFSKGDWGKAGEWFDVTMVEEKEKDWHEWQQPLAEVSDLVRFFSEPNDLIVDPLAGGFTTAVACLNLGRRCVAGDIDESVVIRGQDRLQLERQKRRSAGL
jgi:ParB-like chromosome segregation protein Spo0J